MTVLLNLKFFLSAKTLGQEKPYQAWKEIDILSIYLDYFTSLYDGLDFTVNWEKNDFVTLLLAALYLSDVSHISAPLQALTSVVQIVQYSLCTNSQNQN